jgi:ribosomal-protein-alanine N-acetyltransferase
MRYPGDVPTLTDGTVSLRALRPDDAEAVYEQCQDSRTQQWTTVPVPYSRHDAAEFVDHVRKNWLADSSWTFAIETDGGAGPGGFAGSIALRPENPGIADVGFGAHPTVRGRGVMTRALGLLLDWGFQATPVRTVIWRANAGNIASWRVAWANGFSFDGTAREILPQRGALHDAWLGSLRASDTREPKNRWLDWPILQSERLRLRPPRRHDVERQYEAARDPVSWHWLAEYSAPKKRDDVIRWIRDRPLQPGLGKGVDWALADPLTDAYLGSLNVFDLAGIDHRTGEIGYWLHPDARGRGLIREAIQLVLPVLFGPEDAGGVSLRRLRANVSDGNAPSVRLLEALGFKECGRDRLTSVLGDGSVVDTLRYELLVS